MDEQNPDFLDYLSNASPLLYLLSGASGAAGAATHGVASALLRRQGAQALAPYANARTLGGAYPDVFNEAALRLYREQKKISDAEDVDQEYFQQWLSHPERKPQIDSIIAERAKKDLSVLGFLPRKRTAQQFQRTGLGDYLSDMLPVIAERGGQAGDPLQDYLDSQAARKTAWLEDPLQNPEPDSRMRQWATRRRLSKANLPFDPDKLPVTAATAKESGLTRFGTSKIAGIVEQAAKPTRVGKLMNLGTPGVRGIAKSPTAAGIITGGISALGVAGANKIIPWYRAAKEAAKPDKPDASNGSNEPQPVKMLNANQTNYKLQIDYDKTFHGMTEADKATMPARRKALQWIQKVYSESRKPSSNYDPVEVQEWINAVSKRYGLK